MESGHFGDGLMVRGKYLIFLQGLSDHSYRPYEEMILMKPQIVVYPTAEFKLFYRMPRNLDVQFLINIFVGKRLIFGQKSDFGENFDF